MTMTYRRSASLTPKQQIVYAAILTAAEQGLPCPLNMDLEDLIGSDSTSMGPWIIMRLEQLGLIRVRRYQRFREVYVVELGKWTARHPSMQADKPHVPRGTRCRQPVASERKLYKLGAL